ncbi:MAG: NUDIX hydrolase [Lachnospiraceae bacterium]|nr:NUDIX hydrolase [Lachnospiraceae bacterium]
MSQHRPSEEERAYLDAYDISRFPRPSVAADMAVFSILGMDEKEENYRKDPKKSLKLLLIRRGACPCKGCWALPGGFCRPGESTLETARRELLEETGVKDAYLNPFSIFSEPGRDPRGWIISHGFLALIDGARYEVRGGADAWEARWFCVSLNRHSLKKEIEESEARISCVYDLCLTDEEGAVPEIRAVLTEEKKFRNHHETVHDEIQTSGGLAFDHARIILRACLALRKEAGETGRIVFDLMPERFTLKSLQKAYETIQGRPFLTANFRRKIAPYVRETEEILDGAGHRPARLFRRNLEAFYEEG